ncbi:MAG: phosphoglucomutase/phosphomannomutase family protein [Endomicrobium sp.]|jgi:alpha-D-glucose phosphate-specific phosphoglucomutase|nr:phosphoglucomutase/phosphomannomutase family protein [Endomicrobium sp.]
MIKFGTSGWRGIIAKEFTYANVAVVSQAIAKNINENFHKASIIIGYDTRFMSEDFAKFAAEIFAGNNIKVLLCRENTPTPVISYNIVNLKLSAGINFTASHNSYRYNGIKYFSSCGGTVLPEITKKLEKCCSFIKFKSIKTVPFETCIKNNIIEIYDPRPDYIKKIKKLVNFEALKKSNIKVVIDILHGTGYGYLNRLLEDAGIQHTIINKNRDVMFNGKVPEPSEENLYKLSGMIKKESYALGLSVDSDADRFGIIDTDGTFISPNYVISILLYHLVRTRGWKGTVVKSIMTTNLLDKIARKMGIEIMETKTGFKYIGNVMINDHNNFIMGAEESGGLTIRGHIPEKDGILACLLTLEAVILNKKSLKDILKDIKKFTGEIFSSKLNLYLLPEFIKNLKNILKTKVINNIAGMNVQKNITIDGYKFIFDNNTWMGFRFSGTEPVVRIYAEATSKAKLNKLLIKGKAFIYGNQK